jgi:hypothetical protein
MAGVALPSTSQADEGGVCASFRALVSAAAHGGAPLVVSYSNSHRRANELTIASCWPSDQATAEAFCRAVLEASGAHGFHRFPSWIAQCVRDAGAAPHVRRDRRAGWGPDVRSVEADLSGGLRVEVSFRPDAGQAPDEAVHDYYGTYQLLIRRR